MASDNLEVLLSPLLNDEFNIYLFIITSLAFNLDRITILMANFMFSRMSNPVELKRRLYYISGSRKPKMAANKLEVLYSFASRLDI